MYIILLTSRIYWHNKSYLYGVIINDCPIVGGCALCFRCAATPTSCYKHLLVIYLTSSCVNWAFFDMSGPDGR
jgi:hypothetical protein